LRSLLRSLEDHGGLEELTDTSSFEGELLVEVSLHLLFRGLGFEANFSLDFVVDGLLLLVNDIYLPFDLVFGGGVFATFFSDGLF